MVSNVIILGCGRSGTSIFGELFEHIPAFKYYSEPPLKEVFRFDYTRPHAIKVPRDDPDFPPSPGLSFPLETLLEKIPGPLTIFWQVRHPLDTICSLKVGISRNWGHHPQPPDWKDWLSKPLLEQCAHHWLYINTTGYHTVKHLAKVSHFEDMIEQPLKFARAIVRQLGMNPHDCDSGLRQWADRVQNTHNEKYIEAKTSRPYSTQDHSVKIGRWKENLTAEEASMLWEKVAKTAKVFGYSK